MIVSAAIKINNLILSLPKPARHHNIIHEYNSYDLNPSLESEEGFLTDDGDFLRRVSAMRHVLIHDQLMIRGKDGYRGQELFSEDLW